MKEHQLKDKVREIDQKISELKERCSIKKSTKNGFLKNQVFWNVISEICTFMIFGAALGYFLDLKFASKPIFFTLLMCLAAFACMKHIMKMR